ncbi:bifunctional phosphopantothenoylcysteine decarboxylase/phosphopantothenate--cysteine ligase CoaBC [Bacillus spongiae]|uniref:Coenzyme A biosynthesis bifunctional protein CoaBC n=1 Tax=Bacillus spongiae TaxID=2683610 RepID=A0ABU8H9Z2_9BACI
MLTGKKILLCVSGGIAVYKAAALTSKLTQSGATVKVIMTESAQQFVAPLTFQALSRNPVYTDTFDEKDPSVIAHIDLADWADLILVAPSTANVIGKLANGIADDMLTTTLLASTAPVWIAPAMNVHMYDHPAVKKNIESLAAFGYEFVEPSEGYLACGYVGKGRLEEPEKIVEIMENYFSNSTLLAGKKVLITAGPTRESLDPVRFFSNHSTGKMGFSLAHQAQKLGAEVILISGPTTLTPPNNVDFRPVESALEMYEEVMKSYVDQDIIIKSAAVADYTPVKVANEKIKKQEGIYTIEMERTMDILRTLGERKTNHFLVGFAAETHSVEEYALRKLKKKNADMIIANNVAMEGAGFGVDTNIVTMYLGNGEKIELPLLSKQETARQILMEISRQVDVQ